MGLLDGKRVLVFGVANKNSIAWGISQKLRDEGAELAFSYAMPKLEHRVRPLAESVGATFVEMCDVTNDDEIAAVFAKYREQFGTLDGLVHCVAFAPTEDLNGNFSDVSRAGFLQTLDISAYSLIALTRAAIPLMPDGGTVLTMSSYAAEKVIPRYNVMAVAKAALECEVRYLAVELGPRNIRVNAISAGLIRTLAAQAMDEFQDLYRFSREITPLGRNMTIEDVGGAALYLMSDLGSAVTGETLHMDGGYSALGISLPPSLLERLQREG
jgi:enoyl-[acyl-carrier protein] reductase I